MWSSGALTSEYLNIEDILATHERVPCQFDIPVIGLGYLDPSSDEPDLHENTKLELPLWLAEGLVNRRPVVSVELPKAYRESYRPVFHADAEAVDLYRLGAYFYGLGAHLLPLIQQETSGVISMLIKAFQGRFSRILNVCLSDMDGEALAGGGRREEAVERAILTAGLRARAAMRRWERGASSREPKPKRVRLS